MAKRNAFLCQNDSPPASYRVFVAGILKVVIPEKFITTYVGGNKSVRISLLSSLESLCISQPW